MQCVGVLRAEEYSPGSVGKDRAILEAVTERFHGRLITEDEVTTLCPYPDMLIFSMARRPETLCALRQLENSGIRIINPPKGVALCGKSSVEQIMRKNHLPLPPVKGADGYWLKRGDMSVTAGGGIEFCRNEQELADAKARFLKRGITDMMVQAHVIGDVVKFYGVLSMEQGNERSFFRCYPSQYDQAVTHSLVLEAERLAHLVGIPVYGGDAIVTPDGNFYIIDFNDWPSFAPCMEEASCAIAGLVGY